MSKVTIIIPVYNSAEYIGKCIESILNQTYHDYDILIVNDGSKDNSQQIINEYKEKYPNKITAIEQENKRVETLLVSMGVMGFLGDLREDRSRARPVGGSARRSIPSEREQPCCDL